MERYSDRNSVNTSITTSAEESSTWTSYFEYFLASEEKKRSGDQAVASSFVSLSNEYATGGSSSAVYDHAASSAGEPFVGLAVIPGACRNGKVKKRRARGFLDEDPLEDTASSPVNSPKVNDLIQLESSPSKHTIPLRRDTRMIPKEAEMLQGRGHEYTELKKKGLCLVPVSMLLDYVG